MLQRVTYINDWAYVLEVFIAEKLALIISLHLLNFFTFVSYLNAFYDLFNICLSLNGPSYSIHLMTFAFQIEKVLGTERFGS